MSIIILILSVTVNFKIHCLKDFKSVIFREGALILMGNVI